MLRQTAYSNEDKNLAYIIYPSSSNEKTTQAIGQIEPIADRNRRKHKQRCTLIRYITDGQTGLMFSSPRIISFVTGVPHRDNTPPEQIDHITRRPGDILPQRL